MAIEIVKLLVLITMNLHRDRIQYYLFTESTGATIKNARQKCALLI